MIPFYSVIVLGVLLKALKTETVDHSTRPPYSVGRTGFSRWMCVYPGDLFHFKDDDWVIKNGWTRNVSNGAKNAAASLAMLNVNRTPCNRNVTWNGQVLTAPQFGRVNQFQATWTDASAISESETAERKIPQKSRGQSVSPYKHPSESSTKNQRQQSKQREINTGGQIHTNLLNESRDMSTPWLTANRKELFGGTVSQGYNICQFKRRDYANVRLLSTEAVIPTKNSPAILRSEDIKNVINEAIRIPVRFSPQETKTDKPEDLINGIYFSDDTESLCKVALFDFPDKGWFERVDLKDIYRMDTNGCGNGQNRLVIFEDGTKACVRYRSNIDQIQGEVYSYYLSKLLNMNNVLRPTISRIEPDSRHWTRVRDLVSAAQWATRTPFVFTKWVENLTETHIPREILGSGEKLFPGLFSGVNKTVMDICQLLQWSDLIIFDFLTGHLDRVVNMMHNSKWSPTIFSKPVHNLLSSKTSAKLILLDNESGLIHGYRALNKFADYHERLLKSVCIFRYGTVNAVERLHSFENVGEKIHKLLSSEDINHRLIPNLPDNVIRTLQERIALVYKHIQTCATTRII